MTYEQAKAIAAEIHDKVTQLGAVLNTFPRRPDGLTPDSVKFSPTYQRAKADFNVAFAELRTFNAWFVKKHGEQRRAEFRTLRR